MGSIRSLATITILGIVAAFLYVKINEAPMPGGQQGQAVPGVPPLGTLSVPDRRAERLRCDRQQRSTGLVGPGRRATNGCGRGSCSGRCGWRGRAESVDRAAADPGDPGHARPA